MRRPNHLHERFSLRPSLRIDPLCALLCWRLIRRPTALLVVVSVEHQGNLVSDIMVSLSSFSSSSGKHGFQRSRPTLHLLVRLSR